MTAGLLDKPRLGPRSIEPRDYQRDAIDAVRSEFLKGIRRTMVVLPTGMGKTHMFAGATRMTIEKGGKALILVHRKGLVRQTVNALDQWGIEPGVEWADQYARALFEPDAVVAMIQTMHPRRLATWDPDFFNLLIIDECFPSGTMIDGRPIEQIQVGDIVSSFSHAAFSNKVEPRPVVRLFKKPAKDLVRVWFKDGTHLVCTKNHPVFVDSIGYVAAGGLTDTHSIIRRLQRDADQPEGLHGLREDLPTQKLEQHHDSNMFSGVQGEASGSQTQDRGVAVQPVRQGGGVLRDECAFARDEGEGLLLGGVQEGVEAKGFVGGHGEHKPRACVGPHEGEKPDGQPGVQREDDGETQGDRSQAADPGRKRTWAYGTAIAIGSSLRLGHGSDRADWAQPVGRIDAPDALQVRCCKAGPENHSGSRRAITRSPVTQGTRPKEGGVFEVVRVDRVEVLQPGSDGRFGGLCPDGFVYNIEVEHNHNYFASDILVHNCHHSVSPTYEKIVKYFSKARVLGVTATADRADEEDLGQIFESVAYETTLWDGMTAPPPGPWLCRLRIVQCDVEIDLRDLTPKGDDFTDDDLEARITPMIETLSNAIKQEIGGRQTIVFLPRVKSAQAMATALQSLGLKADWSSGEDPDQERKLDQYREGETQVFCNVGLATEGFDAPETAAVVLCRPTKSRALLAQMIGRGTRLKRGHPDTIVVDFNYLTTTHELVKLTELLSSPRFDDETLEIAQELMTKDKQLDLTMAVERAEKMHKEQTVLRIKARDRKVNYRKTSYDPLDAFDALGVPWRGGKDSVVNRATPRQIDLLNQFKIHDAEHLSKTRASTLLDICMRRRKEGKASPAQVHWSIAKGMDPDKARNAPKAEVSAFLDAAFGKPR